MSERSRSVEGDFREIYHEEGHIANWKLTPEALASFDRELEEIGVTVAGFDKEIAEANAAIEREIAEIPVTMAAIDRETKKLLGDLEKAAVGKIQEMAEDDLDDDEWIAECPEPKTVPEPKTEKREFRAGGKRVTLLVRVEEAEEVPLPRIFPSRSYFNKRGEFVRTGPAGRWR